jgi:hypothetical protein
MKEDRWRKKYFFTEIKLHIVLYNYCIKYVTVTIKVVNLQKRQDLIDKK